MVQFGVDYASSLRAPVAIELVGDVGVGKTTFVRGLARGLGVSEPISSPSFTISRTYQGKDYRLCHYDFYRLSEPGLMAEDLRESLADQDTITVVEWGSTLDDVLPKNRTTITITLNDDESREVTVR